MKNQICQLCCCDYDNSVTASTSAVLNDNKNNSNLFNLIYKHLHITIQDIHNVCIQCEQIIIHWDQFAQKCWTTQTILQESYNIKLESESAEIKEENLSDFSYEDKVEDIQSLLEFDLKFEDPLSQHENDSADLETEQKISPQTPSKSRKRAVSKRKRNYKNEKKKKFNCVTLVCHICSITTKTWAALHAHCLKEHSTKPNVLCVCGKYITGTRTVLRHKAIHNEEKAITCEHCGKKYDSMRSLKLHVLSIHTPKSEYSYSCDQCPKKFGSANSLKYHKKTHSRQGCACDICGAVLTTSNAVKTHKESVHEKLKPCICDVCGKTFSTRGSLKDHKSKHTDQKNFKCDKCDKRYKTKTLLKSHEDRHNEAGFKCPKCPVVLKSRAGLRLHLEIHNPNMKYSCTLCEKKFRRGHHLKVHVNSHYDIKSYKCDLCSKSFTNNQNLKLHKKAKHTSEINE